MSECLTVNDTLSRATKLVNKIRTPSSPLTPFDLKEWAHGRRQTYVRSHDRCAPQKPVISIISFCWFRPHPPSLSLSLCLSASLSRRPSPLSRPPSCSSGRWETQIACFMTRMIRSQHRRHRQRHKKKKKKNTHSKNPNDEGRLIRDIWHLMRLHFEVICASLRP